MKKALAVVLVLAFVSVLAFGQEIAVIVKTGQSGYWQNVQTGCFDAQKELRAKSPQALGYLPGSPVRVGR